MNVLGVFAKWPLPGQAKTRLGLPPEQAAAVARALLLDTLARLSCVAARRVLVFTPMQAFADFATVAGRSYELEPQTDGDLGERLNHFLATQLSTGASKVVVVGTDSPTMPVEYVDRAFAWLDDADVVLGPATDGGYYLLGCRRLPPIFAGIAWSSASVLRDTVARLADPSWKLALLPPWYDVDTREDWIMLRGHIAALRRAGQPTSLTYLEALLCQDSP